jgi:hypothetical protein
MSVGDDLLFVVTSTSHPLAALPMIKMRELRHENLAMFRRDGMTLQTKILKLCRDAGFDPKVFMKVHEAPIIIEL